MIDLPVLPEEPLFDDAPPVHTREVDTLWMQVGGTICNLRCHHCFIRCSPENDRFGFMTLAQCKPYLAEAAELGVKEFYFTGGEPFANPEMAAILREAMRIAPCTVLTNATLFRPGILDDLASIERSSIYSLEVRVSLDGYSAEMNDPIRGEGTFDRAMEGVRRLVAAGFLPILTITRTWQEPDEVVLSSFVEMLKRSGYARPRLKILPLLKLGAEEDRSGGYGDEARVTETMMREYNESDLVCKSSRTVTDQGVWVCPILLDSPSARMGDGLRDAVRDYPLRHQACYTCWQYGAICSNVSTAATQTTDA